MMMQIMMVMFIVFKNNIKGIWKGILKNKNMKKIKHKRLYKTFGVKTTTTIAPCMAGQKDNNNK